MLNRMRRFLALAAAALAVGLGHEALTSLFGVVGVSLAFPSVGTTAGVDGNVNEAMKIIFEEPLTNSIVEDSEMLDIFEQDMNVQVNQTTGGRYIEMAHYFNLPAGVGARRLEGDYIPVPNGPVIKNSQVYLKKIEGVVQMTGDTMRRVKKGEGAFANWARRHLPDLKTRIDHYIDQQLFGYGSGIKARVNDADPDASATITIDSLYGLGYEDPWLAFMERESVVFGPNADGSSLRDSGASYIVEQVDPDNNTITLDGAVTINVADNDYTFLGDDAGNAGAGGGDDREIMGLLGIVDDGTVLADFQGLTRADYTPWRAQKLDAQTLAGNTGEVTEDLLDYADILVFQRATAEIDTLIMSRWAARDFWIQLKNDKRINDPRSFVGGHDNLTMIFGDRDVELRTPRKCPRNLIFGLTRETFKQWRNTGWEWDDLTGSIWNRVTDATGRKDSFYAVGHIVMQTGNTAPHKNILIHNLDV